MCEKKLGRKYGVLERRKRGAKFTWEGDREFLGLGSQASRACRNASWLRLWLEVESRAGREKEKGSEIRWCFTRTAQALQEHTASASER